MPLKLATTTPVLVCPRVRCVATPVKVASPSPSVTAVPTDVPLSVKETVAPEMPCPVTGDLRVALRVAVPPKGAVPAAPERTEPAWLTTRLPVPSVAAVKSVLPAKLATTAPVLVPTAASSS